MNHKGVIRTAPATPGLLIIQAISLVGEKTIQLLGRSRWIWGDFTVHTKSGFTIKFIPHKEPISRYCNLFF